MEAELIVAHDMLSDMPGKEGRGVGARGEGAEGMLKMSCGLRAGR